MFNIQRTVECVWGRNDMGILVSVAKRGKGNTPRFYRLLPQPERGGVSH